MFMYETQNLTGLLKLFFQSPYLQALYSSKNYLDNAFFCHTEGIRQPYPESISNTYD